MKNNFVRVLSIIVVVVMMTIMMTACSGGRESYKDAVDDYGYTNSMDSVSSNIERLWLSVQTKDFDGLMKAVDMRVAEFGGYIESSNIYGNGFDMHGSRDACMVLRIPSDKSDEFVTFISDNSAVVNKELKTEDVTLQYVDVESRIKALILEKSSLENLLENAVAIEDVIYIQDKLMDVIYELESANSQLRAFDNLIDYTTITLNIVEVERTMVVEAQTVWQEIATKFVNNIDDIVDDIVDIFIYVVAYSPYLIINIGFLVVVIILIRKGVKKAKAKAESAKVEQSANEVMSSDN